MASVPRPQPALQPTNLAPLPQLFAYTQSLGLERWLARPKRGVSTLVVSRLWLTVAWRSTREHQGAARPARRGRALLGRRLAGVVADGGCTSRPAVAARLAARLPFILGFARSA